MLVSAVLFALVLGCIIQLYFSLVMKPSKIRNILKKQGIHGPTPKILLGNVLEIKKSLDAAANASAPAAGPPPVHGAAHIFPFLKEWRKQHGRLFTFSLGNNQVLHVSDPNVVKELATTTAKDMAMPSYHGKALGPLLGNGILASNGLIWARQRKIIAPELFEDKVRGMMSTVGESARTVVDTWKQEIEANGGRAIDVDVVGYMRRFSREILSRACFGSNYTQGQDIFLMLENLEELVSKKIASMGLPGLRHIPTKSNREIWALQKEVQVSILKVVEERRGAGYEKLDLLQALVEGAKETFSTSAETDEFIVDNCKNIYLAGADTPAVSASWCLMLLALNPEWQTRVRDEVEQVSGGRAPDDIGMLRKMKQLHMVIQETMRLYPPAPTVSREVVKDAKIGGVRMPKGMDVWAAVARLHTDPDIWGPDALEFKPERFHDGVSGACNSPNCYMPFGFGQRVCVGQHLAMAELKLLMALIVSNFSFSLSPNYVHEPVMMMSVKPKHGVHILIKNI